MAYASGNPKSKAELKRKLKAGEKVRVFYPGLGSLPEGGGKVYLEGPHYPKPHHWYAEAMVDADGYITSIK